MERNIDQILEELYMLDQGFKAHEKELRALVSEILLSRPDTKFDVQFAKTLRERLLRTAPSPAQRISPYATFAMLSRLQFAFGGALVAFLIIAPLTYYFTQRSETDISGGFFLMPQVIEKESNAFGSLSLNNVAGGMGGVPDGRGSAESMPQIPATDSSGSTMSSMGLAAPSAKSGDGRSVMMVPTDVVQYEYVYEGEPISIEASAPVYKRVANGVSSEQLSRVIRNTKFDLVDLKAFNNLQVTNLELAENKDEGYAVSINFTEGYIGIYPDWRRWGGVASVKDMPSGNIPPENMPEKNAVIAAANTFLNKYGIDRSIYGEPVFEERFYALYDSVGRIMGVPETASVIYPLQLEDGTVYDEGGMPYGLNVSISLRDMHVTGVYNLTSQVYERSTYDLEQNMDTVVTRLNERGRFYDSGFGTIRTEQVTLGTPVRVLMRYFVYNNNRTEELYLPALSFPVTSETKGYMPQTVVVPLVKEFLRDSNQVDPMPVPLPTPLIEGNR